MLKKDPNYRRLKIGGRGFFGTCEYWLGADHLLMVEVGGYTERYRRFYFRDTQAIVVQNTNHRLVLNGLVWLAMVLILVIFALAMSGQKIGYVSALVLVGLELVPAALLLVNKRSGPTCTVHLRTAVQTQKLGNLVRWQKAERLVAELAPRVQAAQAAFVVASAPTQPFAGSVVEPSAPVELPPEAPPPPVE